MKTISEKTSELMEGILQIAPDITPDQKRLLQSLISFVVKDHAHDLLQEIITLFAQKNVTT